MKNIITIKLIIIAILIGCIASVVATTSSEDASRPVRVFGTPDTADDTPMDLPVIKPAAASPENFSKEVAAMKKRSYKTAKSNTFNEEAALSVPFRNIRNQFIGGPVVLKDGRQINIPGAKSHTDIDHLLTELEHKFRQPDSALNQHQDSRLLAAQLLMLRPFKGFITRAKDIFDTPEGHAQTARMFAITILRFMAAGIDVYLPTEQWSAAFDYIVQPFHPKPSSSRKKRRLSAACHESWNEKCYINNAADFTGMATPGRASPT